MTFNSTKIFEGNIWEVLYISWENIFVGLDIILSLILMIIHSFIGVMS